MDGFDRFRDGCTEFSVGDRVYAARPMPGGPEPHFEYGVIRGGRVAPDGSLAVGYVSFDGGDILEVPGKDAYMTSKMGG